MDHMRGHDSVSLLKRDRLTVHNRCYFCDALPEEFHRFCGRAHFDVAVIRGHAGVRTLQGLFDSSYTDRPDVIASETAHNRSYVCKQGCKLEFILTNNISDNRLTL